MDITSVCPSKRLKSYLFIFCFVRVVQPRKRTERLNTIITYLFRKFFIWMIDKVITQLNCSQVEDFLEYRHNCKYVQQDTNRSELLCWKHTNTHSLVFLSWEYKANEITKFQHRRKIYCESLGRHSLCVFCVTNYSCTTCWRDGIDFVISRLCSSQREYDHVTWKRHSHSNWQQCNTDAVSTNKLTATFNYVYYSWWMNRFSLY